mmetsp:Transcript_10497/g.30695  ORF Transcript_10497/g.30695 Transcript_10497/m.30695 type:complete len:204 (+) Transcript_10497:1079-1690(+)
MGHGGIHEFPHEDGHPHERDIKTRRPQHRNDARREKSQAVSPAEGDLERIVVLGTSRAAGRVVDPVGSVLAQVPGHSGDPGSRKEGNPPTPRQELLVGQELPHEGPAQVPQERPDVGGHHGQAAVVTPLLARTLLHCVDQGGRQLPAHADSLGQSTQAQQHRAEYPDLLVGREASHDCGRNGHEVQGLCQSLLSAVFVPDVPD